MARPIRTRASLMSKKRMTTRRSLKKKLSQLRPSQSEPFLGLSVRELPLPLSRKRKNSLRRDKPAPSRSQRHIKMWMTLSRNSQIKKTSSHSRSRHLVRNASTHRMAPSSTLLWPRSVSKDSQMAPSRSKKSRRLRQRNLSRNRLFSRRASGTQTL